jgi:hypothetical protein
MFAFLNWFFFIVTVLWSGFIFYKRKYYFIKPSILLITFSIIFFQLPLAIFSDIYEAAVPDPYILGFLIHAYILLGLIVSLYTFQESSRAVWNRIIRESVSDHRVNKPAVVILAGAVICIVTIYLVHVPFRETGLYAVLANPALAGMARERSLKLLDNHALVYAFSLMTSSLAPMLAVILSWMGAKYLLKRRFVPLFITGIAAISLMIMVSLPGARLSAVNLLLVISISFFLVRRFPFHPVKIFLLLILIVTPGVLIGMYREGRAFGFDLYFQYLWDFIGRRILQDPLEVGSWYIHHAQTYGLFGISAVPKLAAITGFDVLDVTNYIGLRYQSHAGPTVSAGAGYLLTYYSYFGIPSLLISLIGLWLLDTAVCVYQKLSRPLLIPCISAVSLSTLSFISSDYTTVMVTHGFAVTLIIAFTVDAMTTRSRPRVA